MTRGKSAQAQELCQAQVAAQPQNAAAWHLLGLAQQRLGRLDAAVDSLSKATSLDRRDARYQHDLANALMEQGKVDRAISSYRRALRTDESLAEAHNDLGTAYFEKRWYTEAEECFRRAIELKPEHHIAHANLGAALRAQGRLVDSRRAFQRGLLLKLRAALPRALRWRVRGDAEKRAAAPAAKADEADLRSISDALSNGNVAEASARAAELAARFPQDPDVLHVQAATLEDARRYAEGLAKIDAAIAQNPHRSEFQATRARLLVRLNRHDEAIGAAERALKLEPGSAEVFAKVAGIFHLWRDDLAVQAGTRAIELNPQLAVAHGNLAAALWTQGRLEQAERHARESVRLKPKQLSFRANLALILKDLGRIDEARALYRQIVSEAPQHGKLAADMGTLAVECDGDLDAAREWLRKAQALSDNPRPFLAGAIVELLAGRFDAAWPLYEYRKQVPDQRYQHELFARYPSWRGEDLGSGRLLVYGEQGLGDEVMFASMFRDLEKRVPNLTLLCDMRLGSLFRRSFPRFEVIAEPRERQASVIDEIKDVRGVVAAGSLGQYFRRHHEDFPRERYLLADPERTSEWRARLARLGSGTKIGLSWIGGHQSTGRSRRSLSLEQLRPVLEIPGVTWISLQYTDCAAEIAAMAAAGIEVHQFPGVTNDMDDLASLIEALDFVVSVCNTTVHIAGATGKEVLVMAPFVPEWRYGMTGEEMVWYASARVLRQAEYGKWDNVLARIVQAVSQRAAQR